MIWVGNFKSLQSALQKPRFGAPLEAVRRKPLAFAADAG